MEQREEKSIEIRLSRKQFDFVYSPQKLFAYIGGVGSGKTFAGSFFAFNQMQQYPKAVGFIGANTVKQLNITTLPPFFSFLERLGIPYEFNKRPPAAWGKPSIRLKKYDGVISACINGELVLALTYTLENPSAYKGVQVGWFWIDETADTSKSAIGVLFERLRGYSEHYPDMIYKGRFTTTPNGFDHMYDWFANPKSKLKNSGFVQATSKDNQINLPNDYVEDLESRLGKTLARQQINGEFISTTGGRAYEYERGKHSALPCVYNPVLPLIWSMDFNVSPMAGLVMQADKKNVWVLDEVCLEDNAQTASAVKEFARRWKGAEAMQDGKSRRAVIAWGDRAGGHRDTRGNESDIDIMMRVLKENFHSVKDGQDYAQRLVIDGINAVNALFNPSVGDPRLFIDPKCEKLIQDMECVSFKPGTKEIEKKKNESLTHFADALRYPIAQMFEIAYSSSLGSLTTGNGGIF